MRNKLVLTLITGILLAAAWPTYGIPVFIFFAFTPLLLVEHDIRMDDQGRKGLRVFGYAYLAFLIWNSITTWWIWYSTPFGMLFALLVNSLLMAIVFSLYHFTAKRFPPKIHLVFLPAIWMAFEKFHLNWDFSWPWLNLGNVFSEYTSWIQWYEYTGTFGGALWIWILNISVYLTILKFYATGDKKTLSKGIAKNVLFIAIPVIISMIILMRYQESAEKIEVVLYQPNVDPYTEKYDSSYTNTMIVKQMEEDTRGDIDRNTQYLIAPETALANNTSLESFDFSREKQELQLFAATNPNLKIITGADFFKLYGKSQKPPTLSANRSSRGDWFDVYNAAIQIDRKGQTQVYFKSKLVVGVETFPFKSILQPLLGNIMIDLGGTVLSRGTQEERSVFHSQDGSYNAAPIICYESVYGEYVSDYVKNGANFLAIITNDAWWDHTQGHQQHLSYARLRAIENRRSVARSANTGISALIDEKGTILKTLAYGVKGTVKGDITINNKKTFYTRYGDYIARIATLIAGFIFLFAIARKKG
ncbi:apolipoprotein N-acyltransferase [Robertkochia solimangrovi]|uniref:apolipoprotein N-acyltransferase n=1 Tax=Robertkochia solimangrovi TaxID=2213046 RepID=UPI00117E89F3|nr:apolipoprotein N-acyltransferase [Robertkochia solimangrovi]TRZ42822.1 apolipoprotein N-acyltransferase [Robertkochia solimangrovi]